MTVMAGYDEFADEAQLWEPDREAVPPVIGRNDHRTGKPLMRYDTSGEVTEVDDADWTDGYTTPDGAQVQISFD